MTKYIYFFDEGNKDMKNLLGGKGAGLAEMTNLELPVPPGFTITTEACKYYVRTGALPEELWNDTVEAIKKLEKLTGKKFGDKENPLLVSARSGAPISMPGMLDTVLNIGLNDDTVLTLAKISKNERFAWDAYRRLIQMFGKIVLGIPASDFENKIEALKESTGAKTDIDLNAEDLKKLVKEFKNIVKDKEFPQDPYKQLKMAIMAVFESWNNERAKVYRKLNNISEELGTAVTIVSMVFGNMGNTSATGVVFTRNPNTGEKKLFGEYLINAQGEDVVAGIRTPKPIENLKEDIPSAYKDLVKSADILEKHYKDIQDIEFTIENSKFYLLQTRSGKRTAYAAVKIAVDMVSEKVLTKEEALLRIDPAHIDALLHPQLDPKEMDKPIAKGLAASPGAGVGVVTLDSEEAVELSKTQKVILVRTETSPDDIHGMAVSQGILTSKGGMTSHAAVVARSMGKPAVVGCEEITVDSRGDKFIAGNVEIHKGDIITIDGSTGKVYKGAKNLITPSMSGELKIVIDWADSYRKLGVRANANTPAEAIKAREFGAEGIGLARTERMFFGPDRLPIMQAMIMSKTKEERIKELNKLLPMQRSDFVEFFKTMKGFPVIIRLLDPPLHEFLPDKIELMQEIFELKMQLRVAVNTKEIDTLIKEISEKENILNIVQNLQQFNPMIGFRGCRVGIMYPEIYEMQVTAIIEAAIETKKQGYEIYPEIMIPISSIDKELKILRERLEPIANQVIQREGIEIKYQLGTMIELPRAALTADKIAKYTDFFSFGTNDLTQTTFGYSRDDAEGKFLGYYVENDILPADPFETIDIEGVGELLKIATERGKKTRPNLEVGICGEHGGDPRSVEFCHTIGLDYVSCSPYRVPIAKLAAAQAAIKEKQSKK
ncbi:MAG: pyruvate, phosphate dikinase [Thermoplasmata archaeon]